MSTATVTGPRTTPLARSPRRPSSSSAGRSADRSRKDKILLLRRLRAAGVREHAAGSLRPAGRFDAGADQPGAFTYFKSLEEPFDATNDAITTLGRLDLQLGDADRPSVRYSYSSNKPLNDDVNGNGLEPNTMGALTNNGTERDRTNIFVGEGHQRVDQAACCSKRAARTGYEERPRDANFEGTSVQSVRRQLRARFRFCQTSSSIGACRSRRT